jgi:hypothetical protein
MKVSKSGAILPFTLRVVISVSLSTLTILTLKSTPIGFVISRTSRAAWMLFGDSERTNRSKDSFVPPFWRTPPSPFFQPASSSIWLAFATSSG